MCLLCPIVYGNNPIVLMKSPGGFSSGGLHVETISFYVRTQECGTFVERELRATNGDDQVFFLGADSNALS